MSHETDLRTAIAYLADLDAELEERGALASRSAHAAARAVLLTDTMSMDSSARKTRPRARPVSGRRCPSASRDSSAQWGFYHVISGSGTVRDVEGVTPIVAGDASVSACAQRRIPDTHP